MADVCPSFIISKSLLKDSALKFIVQVEYSGDSHRIAEIISPG